MSIEWSIRLQKLNIKSNSTTKNTVKTKFLSLCHG